MYIYRQPYYIRNTRGNPADNTVDCFDMNRTGAPVCISFFPLCLSILRVTSISPVYRLSSRIGRFICQLGYIVVYNGYARKRQVGVDGP